MIQLKTLLAFAVPPLCLAAVAAAAVLPLQERAKEKKARTFEECMTDAGSAYGEQRFNAALTALGEATSIVTVKRAEAIHEALPAAPEGWEKKPNEAAKQAADLAKSGMAGLGALAGGMGMSQHEYKTTEGRGRIEVQVMANSPMLAMFAMYAKNPAMLQENQELIKYGEDSAVLETQEKGSKYSLQILLGDSHMCTVELNGGTDEFLFKMFDQAAVDRLKAALSK